MLNLFKRRPDFTTAISGLSQYGVSAESQTRLADFLANAQDRELFHFNPRYLAECLSLNERATLKLLVGALYEGIVTLHWDIRCPACGGVDHRSTSLSQLHRQAQCERCQVAFAPRLDHEVTITFSPHQRLRRLVPSADDAAFRSTIDARLGQVPGQALLVLPEFQQLFPQQRLLPDESLEVASVVVLFTDLAGSTALYASRGDPRAYHLVRLHFDALFRAADDEGGTVVKTIGDAVLAAFQSPGEAMRAALAMQDRIAAVNEGEHLQDDERLILKIGLHSGPCLNVTLNDRPDYFGTTVNIAARVQGLSHGGDLVFTETLRTDPEVSALLGNQPLESDYVRVKGIQEELLVHRLIVAR